MTMARSATSFKPGNLAGLVHGARSVTILQQTRDRLRAQTATWLLELKPDMREPELTIGSRLLSDIDQIGAYIDRAGGVISTRGQLRKCTSELDRLLGRWDQFCKRNGVGYAAQPDEGVHGLAALLARPST